MNDSILRKNEDQKIPEKEIAKTTDQRKNKKIQLASTVSPVKKSTDAIHPINKETKEDSSFDRTDLQLSKINDSD